MPFPWDEDDRKAYKRLDQELENAKAEGRWIQWPRIVAKVILKLEDGTDEDCSALRALFSSTIGNHRHVIESCVRKVWGCRMCVRWIRVLGDHTPSSWPKWINAEDVPRLILEFGIGSLDKGLSVDEYVKWFYQAFGTALQEVLEEHIRIMGTRLDGGEEEKLPIKALVLVVRPDISRGGRTLGGIRVRKDSKKS